MIKLKITGLTCGHCEIAVKRALSGVPGVDKVVRVDRQSGEAVIEGQPDIAALIAAVADEGYQAEVQA